jgi:hypothetical protein
MYMYICCDINTMGVVQHERSLKGTWGIAGSRVFLWLLECSTTSRVFISPYIDTSGCFILLL